MMAINAISILSMILTLYVDSSVQQELKWFKLRAQISKLQCKPINGYGPERITPCYEFHNKKLVPVVQCNLPKNKHCCMYNCACILKGAGDPKGVIPKIYELPKGRLNFAKKNANTPRFRKKGCDTPKPSSTSAALLTTASITTTTKRPKTASKKPGKGPKTAPKKPGKGPKTAPKKPGKGPKPTPQKPNKQTRKPTPKPTKKPRGVTKPKVTPKPCKNQKTTTPSFSFSFFSRFSEVLNGLGFRSRVVRTKPC